MTRTVVVSPHLDDAVLSAASVLMQPGVELLTVCAGAPPEGTPLADWDRLTGAADARQRALDRIVEDDRAAAVLDVELVRRLTFPDGQHLDGPRTDYPAMVEELSAVLAGADEVWVPAGIGCHADHLVVRDAALAAAPTGAAVWHFADVPYSLRYGWPPSVTGQPAASPYLDVDYWFDELLRESGLDAERLTRAVRVLDTEAQQRKVAAMACYVTQIPVLDLGQALAQGDPDVVGFEVTWRRS